MDVWTGDLECRVRVPMGNGRCPAGLVSNTTYMICCFSFVSLAYKTEQTSTLRNCGRRIRGYGNTTGQMAGLHRVYGIWPVGLVIIRHGLGLGFWVWVWSSVLGHGKRIMYDVYDRHKIKQGKCQKK